MKTMLFTQNGRRLKVKAMKIGHNLWLHFNGETWVIDQKPKVSKRNNKSDVGSDSGEIFAPMPGKILRLNVKVGDSVEKDQVVVVMEAMKMEYSLQATCAGTVTEVHCREAQQMELGSLLIKIQNPMKGEK